jgi:hypothetical protein
MAWRTRWSRKKGAVVLAKFRLIVEIEKLGRGWMRTAPGNGVAAARA